MLPFTDLQGATVYT